MYVYVSVCVYIIIGRMERHKHLDLRAVYGINQHMRNDGNGLRIRAICNTMWLQGI